MTIHVKVTSGDPKLAELLLRQSPNRSGNWGNTQFYVNSCVEKYDWWFVLHAGALQEPQKALCDPNHIVFISMEPSELDTPRAFYKQFSKLVMCDHRIKHPDVTYFNGTTWWVGIKVKFEGGHKFSPTVSADYDSLIEMPVPAKKNRISVICSNKKFFPGHHKRLQFLERLRSHPISEHIDFFGGGHNPILDKMDAIAPYKYHLVLENSTIKDYFSEKITDPLLGYALPIYYGCPNINDFFPSDSNIKIDIDDFEGTVKSLQHALNNDFYQNNLGSIIEARNLVLNRFNIFQTMADICKSPASKHQICYLKPASQFKHPLHLRLSRKLVQKAARFNILKRLNSSEA